MSDAKSRLLERLEANRRGSAVGVYSVCSAHPLVLEAAMLQARADDSCLLIEATVNQVNQLGGYTGMKPADFVARVQEIATRTEFPRDRLVLGGDHLGPLPWAEKPAAEAMAAAEEVIRAYVEAGFSKIHVDASMPLSDDTWQGPDARTVAERTAVLCAAAERAAASAGRHPPLYVVGSEVPAPGGGRGGPEDLRITAPEDARKTIESTRAALNALELGETWDRVIALVVQPGVEYGDTYVREYNRREAAPLRELLQDFPRLVFEAQSTDYQLEARLAAMVRDHFCILKVGPALTFALREALFALSDMEKEMLSGRVQVILSDLKEILDGVMLRRPEHWEAYYHGTEDARRFKRRFSYSDRARYYLPDAAVQGAADRLIENLTDNPIPLSLLSQYMPTQYQAVREGRLTTQPQDLVISRIREVLRSYSRACGYGGN